MKKVIIIFLLLTNSALAQLSQQAVETEILTNIFPNGRNEISGQGLQNTLNLMTTSIFQNQGLNGLSISGTPTVGQYIVATGPTTASWQNVSTAIFSTPNIWLALQSFNGGATVPTISSCSDNSTKAASTSFVFNCGGGSTQITGTPSVGWVPLATSTSTAVWGPPPGGVSIKAFGALGDGVQNTNAAWLAAIAAIQASATGCGTVYFPPGTYVTTPAYVFPSCIYAQGAGQSATVLKNNGGLQTVPMGTTVVASGTLTGTGNFGFANPTTYAINALTQGALTITTTTSADAGNFVAGNTVFISGPLHGTNFWYPGWQTTVASVNAGTGVVTLNEALPLNGSGTKATVTITIAAPGVITWTAHGRAAGDAVVLTNSGGALPGGYVAGTTVYVANDGNLTTNTFAVSPTVAQALAGTGQITTTGSQSGTQSAAYATVTLVQLVTNPPTDIKISDLTILGGNQINSAALLCDFCQNVLVDNVAINVSPGDNVRGSSTTFQGRDIIFQNSNVYNYIDCFSCFGAFFRNNVIQHGTFTFDGGAQNSVFDSNIIIDPHNGSLATPAINIVSTASNNIVTHNVVQNATTAGILIGQSNDAQQGRNIICGNQIFGDNPSTTSGIVLELTDGNKICDNMITNVFNGIAFTSTVTNTLLSGNQFSGVTNLTSDDAGVTPQVITPTWLAQWTSPPSGTTAIPVGFGYVQTNNGTATLVTAFSGGSVGQVLTIQFADSNTTIVFGGLLQTLGQGNYNPPSGSMMTFVLTPAGIWRETSRSVNAVAQSAFIRGISAGASNFTSTVGFAGALSGAGVTSLFASPPAIGATAPAAGTFTSLVSNSLRSNGTPPTGNTGTCSTGVTVAGGATAGTWTSTAVCALAGTIILTTMPTQTNGYVCDMSDMTTAGVTITKTATSVTSATFTVQALPTGSVATVANDILQYKCVGY